MSITGTSPGASPANSRSASPVFPVLTGAAADAADKVKRVNERRMSKVIEKLGGGEEGQNRFVDVLLHLSENNLVTAIATFTDLQAGKIKFSSNDRNTILRTAAQMKFV